MSGPNNSNARGNWYSRGRGRGFFARGKFRGQNKYQKSGNGNNKKAPITPAVADPSTSQHTQSITDWFEKTPSPYPGWKLYFSEEGYKEGSSTAYKVKAVETYLVANLKSYSAKDIMQRKSFIIDYKDLLSDESFKTAWFTFQEDLYNNPEHSLNCLGLAMHQVVFNEIQSKLQEKNPMDDKTEVPSVNVPLIRARLYSFEPVIQLRELKANYYEKLVAVEGTIIRVGNVKLLCVMMAFECNSCHNIQCVKQPEGILTPPTKCKTGGCRGRTFIPIHSSPYTKTLNWQTVRLQERASDEERESGRVPHTLECELIEDLLDSCIPGDDVIVTGIIKVRNNEDNVKRKGSGMFIIYIDAVSFVNNKRNSANKGKSPIALKINPKDFQAIKEIHSEPNLFRLLVNSLSPSIYGHEIIKAGLLLAIFGGTQHHADSRADIHVLVVGDPGLGKSQMLRACCNIAPRGVFVCGNNTSTAGLTAALSRESGSDNALEAGALVLADQGCCCIDEFDKMSSQHQALLEAMEQQNVSIAKGGVICSLPARTTILAAANPVGGHYNRGKTISENLRVGSALLSRFDLVFILLDHPSTHLDSLLSEHVIALHSGLKQLDKATPNSSSDLSEGPNVIQPLFERLKYLPTETLDPIPHLLLRKYVSYARTYIHPRISKAAASILQKFYLELRRQHQMPDCTPITSRQLESLIRLTEARAKLELREVATDMDALDVVEIMKHSLVDSFSDEFGNLDFKRSVNGSGMSNRNQAKKFLNALQRRADMQSRSVFSVQELKEVSRTVGIQTSDFMTLLSSLNTQGFILKKGPQLYKLLTVDY